MSTSATTRKVNRNQPDSIKSEKKSEQKKAAKKEKLAPTLKAQSSKESKVSNNLDGSAAPPKAHKKPPTKSMSAGGGAYKNLKTMSTSIASPRQRLEKAAPDSHSIESILGRTIKAA